MICDRLADARGFGSLRARFACSAAGVPLSNLRWRKATSRCVASADRRFLYVTINYFLGSRPAFSPDGELLVAPGFNGATVSWSLDPEDWRRAACSIAGRELTKADWRQYLPGRPARALRSEVNVLYERRYT